MNHPIPSDEPEPISALASYRILDTPPEAVFDALTRMLAARTGAPISLISLIDETRQWFKSRHGIGVEQTPRELAFCAHAIMGTDVMVVEDATRDPRFSDNALVVGEPGIRFYAGAPLRTKDGFNLGTVNVVDLKPRTLGADERVMLEDMARIIVEILELRREANSVVHDERAVARVAAQSSLENARELQASEARLRDITSNVPGVVYQFRIDCDGQPSFPYVSESIRDLFGLDPAEVVRDADTWFDVIHPDDRPDLDASILQSHASLEPWFWEGRAVRSGGDVGWYRGSSTPRKMDDGAVVWNGLVFDITALRQAEQGLRQAQKMEAVGQLTGGVAHDFNNLLAVISGNVELLADEPDADTRALAAIKRAADRGAELTQRLLAFSRRQPLRPRTLDIGELTGKLTGFLVRTLGETVEVETVAPGDLWRAEADPGQVENTLLNLALNARDAMEGVGRMVVKCANVHLGSDDVVANGELPAGDYVSISVTDNGAGMSSDVRARAFEPFFTTKDIGQGSGLGLSMVYGFAKQSGGHVMLESALGVGTTVTLFLPRAEAEARRREDVGPGETPTGHGETILIVEDDGDVRALGIAMVESLGYRAIAVSDAPSAELALAGDMRISLMLTDVVLPRGMSGLELARRVRQSHPTLGIVFMSGYTADVVQLDESIDAGDVLLNKPFQRWQLAEALRDALG